MSPAAEVSHFSAPGILLPRAFWLKRSPEKVVLLLSVTGDKCIHPKNLMAVSEDQTQVYQ